MSTTLNGKAFNMPSDFRFACEILVANRSLRQFPKPKPSNPAARRGLQYENRVGRELTKQVGKNGFIKCEHNPWFIFTDKYGTNNCSPDFLLWHERGIIIVEVKLTWVEVAFAKLSELYVPVIVEALQVPVKPLVICRNLTNNAPIASLSLKAAIENNNPLLHWPDIGHILW